MWTYSYIWRNSMQKGGRWIVYTPCIQENTYYRPGQPIFVCEYLHWHTALNILCLNQHGPTLQVRESLPLPLSPPPPIHNSPSIPTHSQTHTPHRHPPLTSGGREPALNSMWATPTLSYIEVSMCYHWETLSKRTLSVRFSHSVLADDGSDISRRKYEAGKRAIVVGAGGEARPSCEGRRRPGGGRRRPDGGRRRPDGGRWRPNGGGWRRRRGDRRRRLHQSRGYFISDRVEAAGLCR